MVAPLTIFYKGKTFIYSINIYVDRVLNYEEVYFVSTSSSVKYN